MANGVYCIYCIVTQRVYVGSAVDIAHRCATHYDLLTKGKAGSRLLQAAWNEHGPKAFTATTLEECAIDDLLQREQYWMDKLQTYNPAYGYNISPTAGSSKGIKRTDETKRKISAASKRKAPTVHTVESRAKISESNRQRVMSEVTKRRIGDANRAIVQFKRLSKAVASMTQEQWDMLHPFLKQFFRRPV